MIMYINVYVYKHKYQKYIIYYLTRAINYHVP